MAPRGAKSWARSCSPSTAHQFVARSHCFPERLGCLQSLSGPLLESSTAIDVVSPTNHIAAGRKPPTRAQLFLHWIIPAQCCFSRVLEVITTAYFPGWLKVVLPPTPAYESGSDLLHLMTTTWSSYTYPAFGLLYLWAVSSPLLS